MSTSAPSRITPNAPKNLADYAEQCVAAREILLGSDSSPVAADRINSLGDYHTSESAVKRWRQRQPLTVGTLTSPYPRGGPASASWQPRVDLGTTEGSFATMPRAATGAVPDGGDLLELMGLDPDVWMVVNETIRISRWQSPSRDGEPTWLEAFKGTVRPRSAVFDPAEVERILSGYPHPEPGVSTTTTTTDSILLVALADLQAGKIDGGGTPELVETFQRCIASVVQQITDTLAQRVGTLLLLQLGDCIEGIISQGGRLATRLDLSVTEQVRLVRRLLMHAVGELAPLADRLLVASIAGNHDDTTRQFAISPTDSWSLEIASAVADALAMNPAYNHVEFVFPEAGEMSLCINVGTKAASLNVGLVHGHVVRAPNQMINWWRGQSLGGCPVANAHLLFTGHFHHLRVESAGNGRTWVQCPAMESASEWFIHKSGDHQPSGLLTCWLHPGAKHTWSDLRIHG